MLSVTQIRKKYLEIGRAANDTHPGRAGCGKIAAEETERNRMINESCMEINACTHQTKITVWRGVGWGGGGLVGVGRQQ